jgi:type IV pilus assembly protein PilX
MKTCKQGSMNVHQQSGAVLIVALIILVILLIIGLAASRMVQTEEAMSGNFYDRSLAFQAAETALREAEERILTFEYDAEGKETGTAVNLMFDCEADGIECTSVPDPNGRGDGIGWLAIDSGAALSSLNDALPPQYYIDRLYAFNSEATGSSRDASSYQYGSKSRRGVNYIVYRVTARSHDPDDADSKGRALVVLQAMVRRER